MLETLKSGRAYFNSGMLLTGATVMSNALFFLLLVGVVQQVAAAPSQESKPPGNKTRLVQICKADIQRFCDQANLKQECLVAHWDKISAECQGALGASAGNRGGDGS